MYKNYRIETLQKVIASQSIKILELEEHNELLEEQLSQLRKLRDQMMEKQPGVNNVVKLV